MTDEPDQVKRLFTSRKIGKGEFILLSRRKSEEKGDILLDVSFRDRDGDLYVWQPKWDDVRELFSQAYGVEMMQGKSEELKKFEETARHVIERGENSRDSP